MNDSALSSPKNRTAWLYALALGLLFTLGLVIRLYDLRDLPLDFHSTRQMRAAIIARGMYYEGLQSVPTDLRAAAVESWKKESLIEPPILEALSALAYRLAGREDLAIPRVFSITFWLLGAAALSAAARRISGRAGALAAAAYMLVLPYGAIASRSFQPDPLMVAFIAGAVWALLRWSAKPTWRRVIAAGLLGGAAILVKSVAVFFIGGAWVGLLLTERGLRGALRDRQVWLLAALTVLPYGLYHLYGVYISGELASQFNFRFFPALWRDPVFYLRWKSLVASTAGFQWTVVALLATLTVPRREQRALLIGLWAGYFLYGMTLPYHISTHDYYQLPLIPLVALGLAAGLQKLVDHFPSPRWPAAALAAAVLVFVVAVDAWDVRVTLKRTDYRPEIKVWQTLGEKLRGKGRVIGLTHDYGYRLAYWGQVPNDAWLNNADINLQNLAGNQVDLETRFAEAAQNYDLFVVTVRGELDAQPVLSDRLLNGYRLVEETGDYLIFDLHQPLSSGK